MGFLRGALAQSSGCRLPLCRSGSPGLHALCLSGPKLEECPAPLPPHNESTVGQYVTVEDTYLIRLILLEHVSRGQALLSAPATTHAKAWRFTIYWLMTPLWVPYIVHVLCT